jgi:DNA invertase Pin-like site-specific DNA recombinase
MQDVRAGKLDVVVITKLDRLGRSLPHFALLVDELRTHGVGLLAISQGIDTRASNPMGALMLGILGAISEFELSLIRERTRAGVAAARARGTHCGRPPLADSQRQRILDAAARLGGKRVRAIARELEMAPSTVGRVLRAQAEAA